MSGDAALTWACRVGWLTLAAGVVAIVWSTKEKLAAAEAREAVPPVAAAVAVSTIERTAAREVRGGSAAEAVTPARTFLDRGR